MRVAEQALVSFFEHVAQRDKLKLKRLQQDPCFNLEQGYWCFTLPNLYAFLKRQESVFNDIDYKYFRQLIYSSPINQTVKLYGAEIIITDNQAKVDKSGYALIWQKTYGG